MVRILCFEHGDWVVEYERNQGYLDSSNWKGDVSGLMVMELDYESTKTRGEGGEFSFE